MTVDSEFEERKKTLFQPVFFEAGAALLDCQSFEFGIALLLFHLARLGAPGLSPENISNILDDKDKKTAGQLIAMLKTHGKVGPDIVEALTEALRARNYLIHRVLTENIEKMPTSEGREELVRDIRQQRGKVRKAHEKLKKFIIKFSSLLDGLDQQEMERQVKASLL